MLCDSLGAPPSRVFQVDTAHETESSHMMGTMESGINVFVYACWMERTKAFCSVSIIQLLRLNRLYAIDAYTVRIITVGHRLFAVQIVEMAARSAHWSDNAAVQLLRNFALETTPTY